jgi:hypothetical protein
MMMRYLPYLFAAFFQGILLYVFSSDPFFGDAISSTFQAANNIYDANLTTLFYPLDKDPGHPTLYAWLLAFTWKYFGQTLFVSHAFASAWMLCLSCLAIKIYQKLLPAPQTGFALILLFSFSTFLSLSALMLNTTALMFFALLVVYGFVSERKVLIAIGMVLMVSVHLQGTFFVAAFFFAQLFMSWKKHQLVYFLRNEIWLYFLPFTVFCLWLYLHLNHTGWALQSPHYEDTHTQKTIITFLKSQLLIVWRVIDYGMLPIHVLAIFAIVKRKADPLLSVLYISLYVVNALLMGIFLQHTIGHRYFFLQHILGIVLCVQFVFGFQTHRKYFIATMVWLFVVAGNWLFYPGKTIGDATLAYRNYFDIEKQIRNEFGDSLVFYSYAPIGNPSKSKYLDAPQVLNVQRIPDENWDNLQAILVSNVNAEFNQKDILFLKENWYGHTFEKGPVFVTVFLNPKYSSKTVSSSKHRQPGELEKWVIKLKTIIK